MSIVQHTTMRIDKRGMRALLLPLLLALGVTSCHRGDLPTALPAASSPGVRLLDLGHAFSDTITGTEPECRFVVDDEGWGGICHRFDIIIISSGILEVTVRWSAAAPLVLFLKTHAGSQIAMACCSPPIKLQAPVAAKSSYRIEVAYAGRPPGYPHIAPVHYVLETGLRPTDTQSSRDN